MKNKTITIFVIFLFTLSLSLCLCACDEATPPPPPSITAKVSLVEETPESEITDIEIGDQLDWWWWNQDYKVTVSMGVVESEIRLDVYRTRLNGDEEKKWMKGSKLTRPDNDLVGKIIRFKVEIGGEIEKDSYYRILPRPLQPDLHPA